MKNLQALAKSIGAKLSRLSRERGVAYEKILTDFLIERMVARLVRNDMLAECLVFKGGYVALRIFGSPRFTIDLDAVVHDLNIQHAISLVQQSATSDIGDGVWFHFETIEELLHQTEYGGSKLVFRSGLGQKPDNVKRSQIVNFDIGIGDPVVPEPGNSALKPLLGEGSLSWRVYSAESIVSEKIHSLVVRGSGSSRSKDIFDLAFLIDKCRAETLRKALTETFSFRNDPLPPDLVGLLKSLDRQTLRIGWASATADTSEETLDAVFDKFLDILGRLV